MTTPSAPPYDGRHLIADLDGCAAPLDDLALVEAALRAGVDAAGASLLKITLHHFGPGQGVTGVAILAESHISIHSWPEHQYAAIDIFLCGARHDLDAALGAVAAILCPQNIRKVTHLRGYGMESTS
ncbi:MAG: adenosylmethionine decarboxylase [Sphingomonadaceae bacterium]|nr:adenosylmethionine decarboxylase [Sphingomonadaceae bacterium]